MRTWIEFEEFEGIWPKRGDLVYTAIDSRKMRTWFVLWVRPRKQRPGVKPRCDYGRARWWEIEPETRMALYRSAERAGGQRWWYLRSLPKKKRQNFEQYMRRRLGEC